jgi:hypothetical protein
LLFLGFFALPVNYIMAVTPSAQPTLNTDSSKVRIYASPVSTSTTSPGLANPKVLSALAKGFVASAQLQGKVLSLRGQALRQTPEGEWVPG